MAQFCTKCGAPLGEGMKFCTGCGTTVGAPSAPRAQPPAPAPPVVAAATPTLAAPAPPAAPTPAAPSAVVAAPAAAAAPVAKSGSPIVKIILIILAVFFLFGLLGVGACAYWAYRIKKGVTQGMAQYEKQAGITFPTARGTREVRTQPITPAAPAPPAGPVVDTGVAVYPGATPWGGGSQVTGPTASMKTQQYTTSDSVDQVTAFYKGKMGSTAMVTQSGGQVVVQTFGANGGVTIGITSDAALGKTKIVITSIGK